MLRCVKSLQYSFDASMDLYFEPFHVCLKHYDAGMLQYKVST